MNAEIKEIMDELRAAADPAGLEAMRRFGIVAREAYGIRMPWLRQYARQFKKHPQRHEISLALWDTDVYDARILASLLGDPKLVTEAQMDNWVIQFDNWAVCDGVCGNLFDKTPFAVKKALEWAGREAEFEKRAGYVMMATLAVHYKKAPDALFLSFFPLIEEGACDERNFVKKAVNWAIRQIGKRNESLLPQAIALAERIEEQPCKSARWIAADALRELRKKL